MTTDESMQAVYAKSADFTIIGADGAQNWNRNRVENVVVAFPIGDTTEFGWSFRQSAATKSKRRIDRRNRRKRRSRPASGFAGGQAT